jgi:hypothetical protein
MDLQATLASFHKQLTVEVSASVLSGASNFLRLWEERRKLAKKESRSEKEIDAAIKR